MQEKARGLPLFSVFRKARAADRFVKEIVGPHTTEGHRIACELVDNIFGRYMATYLIQPELAQDLVDAGEAVLRRIEIMLVWGVFHEHVQKVPTPVNGYDRISVQVIYYLVHTRNSSFSEARDAALDMQDLFNTDDKVFMDVSRLGMAAYHGTLRDEDLVATLANSFRLFARMRSA